MKSWSRARIFLTAAFCTLAVGVSALSTYAWFQINGTVSPGQTAQTKTLQTNATVYQNNTHSNDDSYQTTATADDAGTLSYDHAKGGKATNFYIRQYNNGVEAKTLQMYTNESNTYDKAAYYNIKFDFDWKIYDASTNEYYGFYELNTGCPVYSSDLDDGGDHNIDITTLTGYYDVYLTSAYKIWITTHAEATTSDQMGYETGWYICGECGSTDTNSSVYGMDGTVSTGIPMYVNAAYKASDHDQAYYAGLRLSDGDKLWIMSGRDVSTRYVTKATGSLSSFVHTANTDSDNDDGYVTYDGDPGYFTLAFTSASTLFFNTWDGLEVNGSTRYTVEDSGGNTLNARNPATNNGNRKEIVKRTISSGSTFYMGLSSCTYWLGASANYAAYFYHNNATCYDDDYVYLDAANWGYGDARFAIYSWTGQTGYWLNMSNDGLRAGLYKAAIDDITGTTGLKFCRMNGGAAANNWDNVWNETGDLTLDNNLFTINGYSYGAWSRYSYTANLNEWVRLESIGNNYYSGTMPSHAYPNVIFVRLNPSADTGSGTPDWNNKWNQTVDIDMPGGGSSNNCYDVSNTTHNGDPGGNYTGSWSLFTTYTVSYHLVAANGDDISEYDPEDTHAQTSFSWTARNLPDLRSEGYGLVNSTYWYAGSDGKTGTTYSAGASQSAISADLDLYARYTALSECDITYYKSYDGVAEVSAYDSETVYQTANFTTPTLPTENGYELVGWNTEVDGSGDTYNENTTYECPTEDTLTLYACYSTVTYDYYIYGVVNGNTNWSETGSSTSGQIHQTGNVRSTTIVWSSQHFNAGDIWRIYRPTYFEGPTPAIWDGTDLQSTNFAENQDGQYDTHNVHMLFSGTYNVTLTLGNGHIDLELVTLDAGNFTLHQCNSSLGDSSSVSATRISNDQFRFTVSSFTAGYYWHIQGPDSSYIWGWSTSENISGTANYTDWFADSESVVTTNKPNRVKNLYSMSCTIDFYFSGTNANKIIVSNISLTSSQFKLVDSSSNVLKTGSYDSSNGLVTFADVSLATQLHWRLEVGGTAVTYGFSAISGASLNILGDTTPSASVYFYTPFGATSYIGTGYGGTYTLVFDTASHEFTSVTCTAFASTNFVLDREYGSDATLTFDSIDDTTNHTATYTGSTHLYIGERMHIKNDNTDTQSGGGSCVHDYYFGSDLSYNATGWSDLVYVSGGYLYSRVDVTITFTFVFAASSSNATFILNSVTENTDISFNHAENTGIYIERTTSSDTAFANSTMTMMHTTDNGDYKAQEAPVIFTEGTIFRVFETKSNTTVSDTSTLTTITAIRNATENRYYSLANDPTGFTGNSGYITVGSSAANKQWTISLTTSNTIHIGTYTGASTQSSEHHVPYYIVGQGMPGSDLRGCDYTLDKAIQMYTWGGNDHNLKCYAGAYGTNNDSSKYKGKGIHLAKGDAFKFSNAGNLIDNTQSVTNNVNYTISAAGLVTILTTGDYYVWLEGSEGAEVINIELKASGTNWTRNDDLVAQNASGVSLIESSGNTLNFGANLDYSLLDAYGTDGYSFVICLDQYSTSAGSVAFKITNGSSYGISVGKYEGTYAANNSYSGTQSIAASSYDDSHFSRTISASTTTYTCFKITISPSAIKSMISTGNYSFSLTIEYTFTETAIS